LTGLEYYGSIGPFFHYDAFQKQMQQLFVQTDLTTVPDCGIDGGVGYGFTNSTEKAILKMIIVRRF
jgi:hypothetical protein